LKKETHLLEEQQKELESLLSKKTKWEKHSTLKTHQRDRLKNIREELSHTEAIIFTDFVGFEFSIGKGTTKFVNVLVFSIESKENGEVHREYLDIVSDSQKTNFAFVHQGFKQLFDSGMLSDFSKLFIFSDNAGKQFKNRRTLRLVSLLLRQHNFTNVEWHMFAENHGWSLCDAYVRFVDITSKSKKKTYHFSFSHGGLVHQIADRAEMRGESPNSQAKLVNMLNNISERVFAYELGNISKHILDFDATVVKGIMKYHSFYFSEQNIIRCREMAECGEEIQIQIDSLLDEDREESTEIINEEVILDETFVSERIKDSVTDFAEIKYNFFRKGILTLMKTIIFFRLVISKVMLLQVIHEPD
jgi:hypothetical protein